MLKDMKKWIFSLFCLFSVSAWAGNPQIQVIGPPEVVYDYTSQKCSDDDHPDNPPRAFIDANQQVNLVFGNSIVYYPATLGNSLNGPLQRLCSYPTTLSRYIDKAAQPSQFENRLWIVNTWTEDGNTVY